ncbi:hypothetical protein B6V72_03760 [Thioclava sp. F34-6]|nr:hypothetical protein B6V72_03760 [Thioclava sp. F34-6]
MRYCADAAAQHGCDRRPHRVGRRAGQAPAAWPLPRSPAPPEAPRPPCAAPPQCPPPPFRHRRGSPKSSRPGRRPDAARSTRRPRRRRDRTPPAVTPPTRVRPRNRPARAAQSMRAVQARVTRTRIPVQPWRHPLSGNRFRLAQRNERKVNFHSPFAASSNFQRFLSRLTEAPW